MTSNQRRPGFRLPWSSGEEAPSEEETGGAAEPAEEATPGADAAGRPEESELEAPAAPPSPTPASAAPTDSPAREPAPAPDPVQKATPSPPTPSPTVLPAPATAARPAVAEETVAPAEPSAGFMRDLVAAMRRVAEETRQASLADLRATSEQQVRGLEADSERHREELRARAEADIAGVGDWARAEEERIKNEAEQRVVGRRAQLDQQLAAETSRAQAEVQALRERLAAYEAELDAYHAQLSDIADPAAFAAAAKRMPPPPLLVGDRAPASVAPEPSAREAANTSEPIHPDEEEVVPALDPTRETDRAAPGADAPGGETAATEATDVLVKGLGSFGAITGFRQALASVDGVEGVSLSLGPTGEFVFRAIHTSGFDVGAAIVELEGDAATIEEHSEGRLRVTLQRTR
jgi:F0F1-type ATP synthase membrane subunit b/b'